MFRRVALLLVAIPAFTLAAGPEPDATHVFEAWLAAFNSADEGRIKAFKQAYDDKEALEETIGFRDFTGGFTLEKIESSQPRSVVALLRQRDGQMSQLRLRLQLAPGEAPQIAAMDFVELPIERLGEAAAIAALNVRASELARADQFSGAYLIARDGRIMAQRALGLADRDTRIAATLDTRFRCASAGKMFTAIATLQLVEAGKLRLDGKLAEYLPDYPNKALASKVTVRHLLTHTGGTGGIETLEPGFAQARARTREHADYIDLHGARALQFEPGSKMEYSNYGFVLLGILIEKVSGTSYYDYVHRYVFVPAGMSSTGALPEAEAVPRRASGYMRKHGKWVSNAATLPYRGMAAGGGYTTVGDMLRFAQALEAGKLVSRAMLAEATKSQTDEGWYGYGFITVGKGPLRRFGHTGNHDGMDADFRIFPESGYVMVSLSNLDPPAAMRLLRYFEPRMPLERTASARSVGESARSR